MRFEATSNPTSTVATSVTPEDEKVRTRARRQTEPLIKKPVDVPRLERRSVDSGSRLPNPKSYNLPTFKGNSSAISSDSLSNPALAGFSPRKVNALKYPTRPGAASSSSPLRQTLQTTRDHNRSSTSTTNITTTSTSTPLSLLSSTVRTSLKLQSGLEPRSPHQKRAPASRSSCGIETSTGPPPALSTQRTLSHDKIWRPIPSLDISSRLNAISRSAGLESQASPSSSSNADAVLNTDSTSAPAAEARQRLSLPVGTDLTKQDNSRMPPVAAQLNGDLSGADDLDGPLQTPDGLSPDTCSKGSSGEDSKSKSEDVFLNIAKATSSLRNSSGRTERRTSKFGLTGLSSRSSRANQETPSPEPGRYDPHQATSLQGQDTFPSLGPATSAHPVDEMGRLRYSGVSARSSLGLRSRLSRTNRELSPESPQSYGSDRRASTQDQGTSRVYRQSNLSATRNNRTTPSSDGAGRARLESERSRLDGTESTLSTNAPSTVWDELDDLKSRIRKLELTGKLPSSSAAAMSSVSGERPRTATTTVTTLSSSPKHGRKASSPPPEPESESVVGQVHPLLHTALAKAKPVLNSGVYRALEASATDALTLASMLSSSASQLGSGMSVANGTSVSDRQVRRKADSICRSLTELCLALSDEQLTSSQKARPESRDATSNVVNVESSTPTTGYRRSVSQEPDDIGRVNASTTRGATNSRLEVRRTSMLNLSSGGARTSQEANGTPPAPVLSTPPNRLSRLSTSLRSRRLQGEEDYDDKSSALSRPLSRAMTEINNSTSAQRFSPRDRLSREYTSSHPLPHQQQQQSTQPQQYQQAGEMRTPSVVQSGIPLRRNFVSPTSNLPKISNLNIQPGFRRYGVSSTRAVVATERATNDPTLEGADLSQQHMQHQLRGAAPVGRSAPHYGSTQQLRPRTNSLGASKISIRQRPVAAITDGSIAAGNELE